jgi:hypothetical protein
MGSDRLSVMIVAFRAALLIPVLLLLASFGVAGQPPSPAPGRSAAPIVLAPHGSVATIPHGNLSIPLALGNTSLAAGTFVVASYQFRVVSWPTGLTNLTVWVNSEQISFPKSTGGTLQLTIPAYSTTVTSGSLSNRNATAANATIGAAGANFSSGSVATLSSQLLAVTASVKWGTVQMSFRWDWASTPSGGGISYSAWSAFQTITPPENLTVLSEGPARISPGDAFNVCIGGPIQNRSFSLHMEVANPYLAFAWNSTRIPSNWTGTFCWGVTMPLWFSNLPAALLVHIWEYNVLPSILYNFHTEGVPLIGGTVNGRIFPTTATAQLGSFPLSLVAGHYSIRVAPKTYTLSASASGFIAGQVSVTVVVNQTTWANLSLKPADGTLTGTVTPHQAQVSFNGTALHVNASSGGFTKLLPPGKYIVHAQATGYSYANASVSIDSNVTTTVSLTLTRLTGWLVGTVTPVTASVTVDRSSIPVGTTGTFNVTLPTALHNVEASLAGYTVWQGRVSISANATTLLAITLEPGWVAGMVNPATANLSLNGAVVTLDPSNGAFNVSQLGGTVWVRASASGYLPFEENITVTPGRTFALTLTLNDTARVQGALRPANATLLWDDRSVPVDQNGSWSWTTTSGPHRLHAAAPGYLSFDEDVTLVAGQHLSLSITLNDTAAVEGALQPANAVLLWDDQTVAVGEQGHWGLITTSGPHWLNASATGYAAQALQVSLQAGERAWENLTLVSLTGLIEGFVTPASASLTVNGSLVTLGAQGDFSMREAPGTYILSASMADHSPVVRSVMVQPGGVNWTYLTLPWNVGWVRGSILPANATVLEGNSAVLTLSGAFNVTLPPGTYLWSSWGAGFLRWNGSVVVYAGQVTNLQIQLVVQSTPPPPPVTPPPVTTPPTTTPPGQSTPGVAHSAAPRLGAGPMLTLLLGVVAVGVVLGSWIAVRRRRRGSQLS